MDEYVELTSPCREQPVSSYNYTKQCIQSTDPAGEYDAYVAVHRSVASITFITPGVGPEGAGDK